MEGGHGVGLNRGCGAEMGRGGGQETFPEKVLNAQRIRKGRRLKDMGVFKTALMRPNYQTINYTR